jgi:hypothetical protein
VWNQNGFSFSLDKIALVSTLPPISNSCENSIKGKKKNIRKRFFIEINLVFIQNPFQ